MNNVSVQMEKPSKIQRKLTITVPAQTIEDHFTKEIVQVQRKAKLKGFRPGMVPLPVVKQYYGADVRHRVLHYLIDESYRWAIQDQKLRTVGTPQIETPGTHEHHIDEGDDLTFTATVDVFPEIELKNYTGIALKKLAVKVTDEDVQSVLDNLRDSQSQLIPLDDAHSVQNNEFVDFTFEGGVVTDAGLDKRPEMSGTRVVQIGSNELIPGFEAEMVGLKKGDQKTFRLTFPDGDSELGGKPVEFSVTINSVKEKKLPELTDELAKTFNAESVDDLKKKARENVVARKTQDSDEKVRDELLKALIDKNPFEIPVSLVQAQMRSLGQELARNLKNQGFDQAMIENALVSEEANLKGRAETQVRAGLLLDTISKKESITVTEERIEAELEKMAKSMRTEVAKIKEFYGKNSDRREDLEFRIREDLTIEFLLSKSKISEK